MNFIQKPKSKIDILTNYLALIFLQDKESFIEEKKMEIKTI